MDKSFLVLYNVAMETQQSPDTNSQQENREKAQKTKDYNSKWSAKFYKFFSLLSFFVYYINCTVRIISRAADYYRSKGVNSVVSYFKIAFDVKLWGEAARAVFDWYTVTLLVFLLVYAIVFFIIFARFSPKRKKTFKYFKKSFSLARKFLKVINIALTLVVLINTAKLTSNDTAGGGDKITFAVSVFSLFFSLIQIALSIATWVITSKIKKNYKTYKEKVSGVSYVMSRYISPNFRRRQTAKAVGATADGKVADTQAIPDGQTADGEETDGQTAQIENAENNTENITQSGDIKDMDGNNKPKSTIAEKLGKIKSRFLRTLAALSLTDKEADEAIKAKEEEEAAKAQAGADDTERFESDYMKNKETDSSKADEAEDEEAADVIEPDESNISISVDEEYVERYKRRKAEKRKESVDDIKKKLGDFGDKVDDAGNKFTDNIKSAYKKVKSKLRPDKKSDGNEEQKNEESDSSKDQSKNAD